MQCPYCASLLREITLTTKSDQEAVIHECLNCGGHWFPRWLANDISGEVAKNIDSVLPKSQIFSPSEPRCPQCQRRLIIIQHDSIAKGITVLNCPEGHGNFFPKNNLYQFKTAQEAKITYHEAWGIPIKSALAVLLPVVVIVTIAAGTPIIVRQIGQSQESRTKASSIIKTPVITPLSPTSVIISFTSSQALTTEIVLYQGSTFISTQTVSATPNTVHTTTLNDLSSGEYTFVIKYFFGGQTNVTEDYPLSIK